MSGTGEVVEEEAILGLLSDLLPYIPMVVVVGGCVSVSSQSQPQFSRLLVDEAQGLRDRGGCRGVEMVRTGQGKARKRKKAMARGVESEEWGVKKERGARTEAVVFRKVFAAKIGLRTQRSALIGRHTGQTFDSCVTQPHFHSDRVFYEWTLEGPWERKKRLCSSELRAKQRPKAKRTSNCFCRGRTQRALAYIHYGLWSR